MVKVLFDRRITRRTPGRFATRVLRQGVVSCLKVVYKTSFLKQYNKGGRVLRTEVCINDPADFGVRKSLVHLEYLKRIAKLAKQVQSGQAEDTPEALKNSPGLRALYNNLQVPGDPMYADAIREARSVYGTAGDPTLSLALAIDETVRRVRPDAWRGHQARENEIKRALLPLLHSNTQEVERVFLIIKAQKEY